jgi:hypothetical protein
MEATFSLGTAGAPCTQDQALACEGHSSQKVLRCNGKTWEVLTTCPADQRCESTSGASQGTCLPIPQPCKNAGPEQEVCSGNARAKCGIDSTTLTQLEACAKGYTCAASNGKSQCANVDECSAANVCGADGKCTDTTPGYKCACADGYQASKGEFPSCTDIDECTGTTVCAGTTEGVAFDYACINEQPYYECQGQFYDWTGASPASRFAAADGVVTDQKTGLNWQQTPDPASNTWDGAKTFCAGLPLAGGGFRLPTVVELLSITDRTLSAPAIDSTVFPGLAYDDFWSSSPFVGNSEEAWSVNFGFGMPGHSTKTFTLRVRCVR